MDGNNVRAAIYCRVSTTEQAEQGFSISAQINLLTEYCNKNNVRIINIYADEGISGQKEDRPQFQIMIRDAEKKLFDIILVHKFDRFARKVELSQRIKSQLKKSGVNVISISEPIEDSPIGFFQEGILELLSEYYVRNLSAEIKKGHTERARQGFHSGSIPFGYRADGREMVIYEPHAEIVRLIFDLYVNRNMGVMQIRRKLNDDGVLSPLGNQWCPSAIRRVLSHHKYIGKIVLKGETYNGHHEPIISEEKFYTAQRLMTERRHNRIRMGSDYDKFLLAGLLRCGYCDWKMQIVRNQRYTYYACYSAYRAITPCKKEIHYPVAKLEDKVIKRLRELLSGVANTDITVKGNISSYIDTRRKRIADELQRAKQAYLSGVFPLDEYGTIRKKLESELNSLISTPSERIISTAKLATLLDEYESCDDLMSKKSVLLKIVRDIYIKKDNIEIVLNI